MTILKIFLHDSEQTNKMSDPICAAAKVDDARTIRQLVKSGAHPKYVWTLDTALCIAAFSGHEATVRALLDCKASVHAVTFDGQPDGPLRWAAKHGHTQTVCALLFFKADVHACGNMCGIDTTIQPDDALRGAASHGHDETVRVLLNARANMEHLSDDFVKQFFTFSSHALSLRAQHNVAIVGRCLRFGPSLLRELRRRGCDMDLIFDRFRKLYLEALPEGGCLQMRDLILSYV